MSARHIIRRIKPVLGLVVFLASLVMFYLIGGWKLPVAMILFEWSMNIENSIKRNN